MTRRPLRPERTNEGPGAALNRIRGTREVPSPLTAATAGLIKLTAAAIVPRIATTLALEHDRRHKMRPLDPEIG